MACNISRLKFRMLFLLAVSSVIIIFPSHSSLALEKIVHNSIGMEFVLIPAGKYVMGTPSHEPYRSETEVQHEVTISSPFYIHRQQK